MRLRVLTSPRLFFERLSSKISEYSRLISLRKTCAAKLTTWHIDSLELIKIASDNGAKVFFDVGANVGTWTLLCRAVVPESSIVAFEPMPHHLKEFRSNTEGLPRIRLVESALGSRRESRAFYPASFSDASSLLPLTELGRRTWNIDNESSFEVEVETLDGVCAREGLPSPDLIKLDVQGFELEVLKGGVETLSHARWVLAEVSFQPYYHDQVLFSPLAGFLASRGFEVMAFGWSMRAGEELKQADVLFRRMSSPNAEIDSVSKASLLDPEPNA